MSSDETRASCPTSLRMRRIRKSSSQAMLVALGASAALGTSPAIAQDTGEDEIELGTLSIEDRAADTNPYTEEGAPYKAKISGDSRRAAPIAETPATISVITETALDDAGTTDLRETLRRQPGISLGTGENGNAFGDRYVIRGFEARSDVFVDGLRDPGMTIRETFAVEQVEVTKGPSSTFAGRGSSGGAINSITKQASAEYDFTKLEIGVGTDDYRRISADVNIPLSSELAVRIIGLHDFEEVPDRGPAERKRDGFAASLVPTPEGSAYSFGADFYYLNADGDTDLGTYTVRDGDPVDDIPVYAQDEDLLESEIQVLTLNQSWDASDNLRFENTFRFGETENGYVLTGARGSRGYATNPDEDANAVAFDTISLSTHQGWQEVEYMVDQLNAYFDTTLGGLDHQFVIGAEWSDLNVVNGVYSVTNTGDTNCFSSGRRGVSAGYCGINADSTVAANLNSLLGRQIVRGGQDSDYNIETLSLYVMDTISLTERLTVHGGIRWDDFDYRNDVVGRGATTATTYAYSDSLWNGHVGVVYDVTDQGNVYFTYSTAANINGGESDVGGSCGYGGLCGAADEIDLAEPEDVTNLELGTKWNVLDEKLLLTAALFQITKDNVMQVANGADYTTEGEFNTGKIEVQGIEIGAVGNITDDLSIQAGAAFMDSEVVESANESDIGAPLANFADNSAYVQMRYQLHPQFAFGGAVTYSSEIYSGQPDSAGNTAISAPGYTVLDLFAEYDFNDDLGLRLNVGNVTDEDYYTALYRSGSFTYKGDALNARLTLSARF